MKHLESNTSIIISNRQLYLMNDIQFRIIINVYPAAEILRKRFPLWSRFLWNLILEEP